ncbi:hypothetical protein VYU27_001919 [Nannochloropsis oceanica]
MPGPSHAPFPHKTWANYLDVLLPLVTGFLVVPLEDAHDAPQWLRELYALSPVTPKFAHEHLVFSRSAWTEGSQYVIYRGASAGVFGLIGASAVIQVEELWAWGHEMWMIYRQKTSVDSTTWRRLGLSFLGLGYNFCSLYGMIKGEYLLRSTNDGIGHSFHIDGFVSGAIIYVGVRCAEGVTKYAKGRNRQRGIGRRLGGRGTTET